MEVDPSLYEPTEPTAADVRAKFVELLAALPAPEVMSDEQLTECAEMMAQISMDVATACEELESTIAARGIDDVPRETPSL